MAIKIRCQECSKKISIDEAFAGGMCRCPYCKALVFVEENSAGGAKSVARPSAPTSRPDAPQMAGAVAPAPAVTEDAAEHVPMANPVKLQGIITIVLLALLVLMVGGGILAAAILLPSGEPPQPPPDTYVAPVKVGGNVEADLGPAVADVKIAPPVVYVIDGGSSMRSLFDGGKLTVVQSIKSLNGAKFNIIVAREGEDKVILSDMTEGNPKGASDAKAAMDDIFAGGATDLARAVKAALAMKPRTIVLITRKPMYEAAELAAAAKDQNTVIHGITIEADSEIVETLKELSAPTGGQTRNLSPGSL